MAKYVFHGPNGRTVTLNGPSGATKAQQAQALRAYLAAHPLPPAQAVQAPRSFLDSALRVAEGLGAGAGMAAVNTIPFADRLIPAKDRAYLQSLPGYKEGEIAGDAGIFMAGVGPAADALKGAELTAKYAPEIANVAVSAAESGLQRHGTAEQDAEAAAEGAAAGAAGTAIGKGVEEAGAHFVKPAYSAAVREAAAIADKYHVPLYLADLAQSAPARFIVSTVKTMPFSGFYKAGEAQRKAFMAAVASVSHLTGDRFTPKALDAAESAFDDDYARIWSHGVTLGEAQLGQIAELGRSLQTQSAAAGERIPRLVQRLLDDAKGRPSIPGARAKSFILGDLKSALGSPDADVRRDAFALRQIVREGLPPEQQQALSAVDRKYGNLQIVKGALASSRDGESGLLDPQKLAGQTHSKYGATPEMHELAQLGQKLLRPMPVNSATALRYVGMRGLFDLLAGAGGGIEAASHPSLIAPALGFVGAGAALGRAVNNEGVAAAARAFGDSAARRAFGAGVKALASPATAALPALSAAHQAPLVITVHPRNTAQGRADMARDQAILRGG